MSHTNSTPNYGLPQFITTDKPFWLTDINGAFSTIDASIDAAKDAADAAQNDATQALTDASAASTAASTADAKGAGAVASIADAFSATNTYSVGAIVMYNNLMYLCNTAVTTPGAWTGSANWERITVDTLKQDKNDNSLATTNKTVVGAINEINSEINDYYYQTLTHTGTGTKFYFARNGHFGQISIDEVSSTVSLPTSWTSIGTIGSGFYKSGNGFWIIPCPIVGNHQIVVRINIANGNVEFQCDTSSNVWAQGRGIYLI